MCAEPSEERSDEKAKPRTWMLTTGPPLPMQPDEVIEARRPALFMQRVSAGPMLTEGEEVRCIELEPVLDLLRAWVALVDKRSRLPKAVEEATDALLREHGREATG